MWEAISLFFLKGFIPIVGYLMQKSAAKEAAKKEFLAFVSAMQKKGNVSVKLHKSYQEQLDKINKLD